MASIKLPFSVVLECLEQNDKELWSEHRWCTTWKYRSPYEDKMYTYLLTEPNTETSGDIEDMNDSEIELTEVHQVEKLVKVWEEV